MRLLVEQADCLLVIRLLTGASQPRRCHIDVAGCGRRREAAGMVRPVGRMRCWRQASATRGQSSRPASFSEEATPTPQRAGTSWASGPPIITLTDILVDVIGG